MAILKIDSTEIPLHKWSKILRILAEKPIKAKRYTRVGNTSYDKLAIVDIISICDKYKPELPVEILHSKAQWKAIYRYFIFIYASEALIQCCILKPDICGKVHASIMHGHRTTIGWLEIYEDIKRVCDNIESDIKSLITIQNETKPKPIK